MRVPRRSWTKMGRLMVACLLVVLAAGTAVYAETIPNKPLQLVVPYGPGGGTDITARLVAPELEKELGVPVQVINIAGGGGWVAWHQMANWKPDEWIIGYVNLPHIFAYLNPEMKRKETLESWNFLLLHVVDPGMIVVREKDPRFRTLEEFIKYVQENPGKITIAAHGVGGDDFLGIKQIEMAIPNFKVNIIHDNSDSTSIAQLMGGHVDAVGANVGVYTPRILEGKIRPLCVNWY
ncbi:hypothetical protein H5U35_06560, partial [Candidatus Aerophobetes bacterium]|nr:hypothetical protein [Candidatus Aerophobetes bacterium]